MHPVVGAQSFNHWATREVPSPLFIRTPVLLDEGPILTITFQLNYLPKRLSPKRVMGGVKPLPD